MFLNTFLGAIIRCVISHVACGSQLVKIVWLCDVYERTVSKSIDWILKSFRKNGGMRMLALLVWFDDIVKRSGSGADSLWLFVVCSGFVLVYGRKLYRALFSEGKSCWRGSNHSMMLYVLSPRDLLKRSEYREVR